MEIGDSPPQTLETLDLHCLFVDLDGTLADTLSLFFNAYSHFMESQGIPPSREEFLSLIGPTLPEIVQILRDKYLIDASPVQLLRAYRSHILNAYAKASLMPGALHFLESAQSQSIPVWIVTSAPRDFAQHFALKHALTPLIQGIVTPENLPHGKPHPAVYEEALKKSGFTPEKSLAIEDSPQGATAAIAAQLSTVLIHSSESVDGIIATVPDWDTLRNRLFSP